MPNPLEMGGPPEAPNIQPQGNALQGGPPQQGAAPQQTPAPSHVQTVAALHHFHAIQTELEGLMKNPALGKSSIKSEIIDGTTKLVSERIISPADAVMQLGKVPDAPLEQRKWVQMMMTQTQQATNAIISHRQNAVMSGIAPQEDPNAAYNPDDHMKTVSGLVASHYSGGR